jgi:hypothetical protein
VRETLLLAAAVIVTEELPLPELEERVSQEAVFETVQAPVEVTATVLFPPADGIDNVEGETLRVAFVLKLATRVWVVPPTSFANWYESIAPNDLPSTVT